MHPTDSVYPYTQGILSIGDKMRNYKIVYLESRCVFKLPLIPYGDTWHASNNSNNGSTIFAIPKDAIMDGLK